MKCTVNTGHSFRRADGSIAGPGDEVEIADEVLTANPGSATVIEDDEQPADPDQQPDA